MADSVDRVFGHALNTVNKIRPGSQKPPSTDRLALYGLYKQSMEGDVAHVADRPSPSPGTTTEQLKKEQEQWDAWKTNEGLSRTEAKRRYIEKLITTMHKYASTTPEARELVEELEFVWDQIKNNSQHSGSEPSPPLQTIERRDYMHSGGSSRNNGVSSSAAALESGGKDKSRGLRVLSPQSEADEDEAAEDEREEFVDAPISQIDEGDLQEASEPGNDGSSPARFVAPRRPVPSVAENRWRRRMESSLIKLTTEIAALREQLESRRYLNYQRKHSWLGWVARLSWWAVQLVVADAVLLWIVILYMRRKQDRRLEGAVRVLLGDAVAQVQNLGTQVKLPALPRIRKPKE